MNTLKRARECFKACSHHALGLKALGTFPRSSVAEAY